MKPQISQNEQVTFPGQLKDEKVISLIRRHWFVLFGFILYLAIMVLLPLFIYAGFDFLFKFPLIGTIRAVFFFLVGLHLLFTVILSFSVFIDYYLDVWIITDQRIISIEQKGLFNRIINEVRYERIQDITSVVPGLIATYFKYGNIMIQTAAEKERMILKQVPDPIETRRLIAEIYDNVMEHHHNNNNGEGTKASVL